MDNKEIFVNVLSTLASVYKALHVIWLQHGSETARDCNFFTCHIATIGIIFACKYYATQ